MREQIEYVIRDNIDSVAIPEIERFTCHREVRAYWVSFCKVGNPNVSDEEAWKECYEYVSGYYPKELITAAIKRVKKEQQ